MPTRFRTAPPQGSPGTPSSLKPQSQGGTPPLKPQPSPSKPTTSKSKSPIAILTSSIPSILSGLICGLVLFVFCCVFSSMIFQRSALLEPALPLGVGMHTVSTLVGSLVFARLSGVKAVIAGPDINPAVFVAEAAAAIVDMAAAARGGAVLNGKCRHHGVTPLL